MAEYRQAHPVPKATVKTIADHIDHIVKVAGIDHVGIGSDYDGIESVPVGLEDVSTYPRLTDELLRRNYSEADIHKILGGNALRALRKAGEVAALLQKTTKPEIDQVKAEKD
jgi:membrane dipeptidase